MKNFDFVIKDELGIHARPAGLIVKEAAKFNASILLQKGEKKADAKKLFALMGLGAKKADTITLTIDGEDEDAACESMKQLLETNL
ncbi:MAG: Phosphotransferase system, phosphocarrier protein HPr [Herbinix sp.]|nr:Phosphotransferase system, phosphocarrier protein HPr [Herbinix sp.]